MVQQLVSRISLLLSLSLPLWLPLRILELKSQGEIKSDRAPSVPP